MTEVFFTWAQLKALGEIHHHLAVCRKRRAVSRGCFLTLDEWDGRELFEKADALVWKTTAQFAMRERLIDKLSWARPEPTARTLAETFGGAG